MADEMLLNKFLLMPDNVCPQHRANSGEGNSLCKREGDGLWTYDIALGEKNVAYET